MAKAVFTFSESSSYDDQPEVRYHFPGTYLAAARASIGDWIVYYEPRRTQGPNSATGRQSYFATARVMAIEADRRREGHYYAHVSDFVEFDRAVPFREGEHYFEAMLVKDNGSTNKGAFGRSVRTLPDHEYRAILAAGFTRDLEPWEVQDGVTEPALLNADRPVETLLLTRPFREASFRRHVRQAYGNRCAMTGLRLVNGGGRPEVQAAHIMPVERNGPDTVRNGIALTGTFHWLFDRGLVSVDDDRRILLSKHGIPSDVARLVLPGQRLMAADRPEHAPHPAYLAWHRKHVFKG